MKKRTVVALSLLLSLSLSGCGQKPVTSVDNPDLRYTKMYTEYSDKEFWNDAYKKIPTVSMADIKSGNYDNSYVLFDAYYLYSEGNSIISVALPEGDGNFRSETFVASDHCYGYKTVDSLNQGHSVKLCLYIDDKAHINGYFYGLKDLGSQSEFDAAAFVKERQKEFEERRQASNEAASSAESETNKVSDNPLMNIDIQTENVWTGDKSKIIGARAFIQISKSEMENITPEQYIEFAKSKIDGSGYNWFTIMFEDGTGIVFAGCYTPLADYGNLDSEGCIAEPGAIGYVEISGDTCSYTDASEVTE